MAVVSSNLFKGLLLDYYYLRRAESECGQGQRFVIKKAIFGRSQIVSQNNTGAGGWTIGVIPADFDLVSNNRGFQAYPDVDVTATPVSSTVINITASLTDKDYAAHPQFDFNTLVLTDAENKAIAVLCCQQDTLYLGKSFTVQMTIEQKVI
ncbi:TPA: phage tail protein [Enterobacter cloacae]